MIVVSIPASIASYLAIVQFPGEAPLPIIAGASMAFLYAILVHRTFQWVHVLVLILLAGLGIIVESEIPLAGVFLSTSIGVSLAYLVALVGGFSNRWSSWIGVVAAAVFMLAQALILHWDDNLGQIEHVLTMLFVVPYAIIQVWAIRRIGAIWIRIVCSLALIACAPLAPSALVFGGVLLFASLLALAVQRVEVSTRKN